MTMEKKTKEDHFEEDEISQDTIGVKMFRLGMVPDMSHFRGGTFCPQVHNPEEHMESMDQIMETMMEAYASPYESSHQEEEEGSMDTKKSVKMKGETNITEKTKVMETKMTNRMEEGTKETDKMKEEDTKKDKMAEGTKRNTKMEERELQRK